ncbi:hypothetical protein GPL15_08150 [Clostridium sp. MCC353]|uniref:hypothetical protein n=1 Tax=Clostridium sp. MCC353 TaxID=2592646 RepID=UPI001C022743|nr:hypothetical protein [Clostridium sp. MCC353]MBT9776473.1 hypothetical protein [Clostridium sp. MCC353]
MRRFKKNTAAMMGAILIMVLGQTTLSYAGTWVRAEDGGFRYETEDGTFASGWLIDDGKWYYFDEEGRMDTGWIMDQGRWYYLSPASGEWIVPPINENTVSYLLENALADAGLYQDEENLDTRIESITKTTVVITVGKIDRPESFRGFAQFKVDRKTRKAEAVFGGTDLEL